jgi:hypothetical protein
MIITFDCLNATNRIVFHSIDHDIDKSKLTLSGGLSINGTEYDALRDFYIVHLDGFCAQDTTYSLSIEYKSIIRGELNGFYRSSYVDSTGVTR